MQLFLNFTYTKRYIYIYFNLLSANVEYTLHDGDVTCVVAPRTSKINRNGF